MEKREDAAKLMVKEFKAYRKEIAKEAIPAETAGREIASFANRYSVWDNVRFDKVQSPGVEMISPLYSTIEKLIFAKAFNDNCKRAVCVVVDMNTYHTFYALSADDKNIITATPKEFMKIEKESIEGTPYYSLRAILTRTEEEHDAAARAEMNNPRKNEALTEDLYDIADIRDFNGPVSFVQAYNIYNKIPTQLAILDIDIKTIRKEEEPVNIKIYDNGKPASRSVAAIEAFIAKCSGSDNFTSDCLDILLEHKKFLEENANETFIK